jgi:hypothetical protein
MSSNTAISGIGGFNNLRAIFENRASEDRSASPPSRGRSPSHSAASIHSRAASKVRTSFIAVERPGDTGEGQHWGLRKASDIANMADVKHETERGSLVNGALKVDGSPPQLNGVHNDLGSQPQQNGSGQVSQGGLGSILKGSAFEVSPPASRSNLLGSAPREPPSSPTASKKNLSTSKMNGKVTPGAQPKPIGSRIKDVVASGQNKPPPPVKLNTTKDAKPIKPPPTRQMPPAKPSAKPPTSPRTPRAPVSPKMEKPMIRGSPAKPTAVAESAKHDTSPGKAEKLPTLPKEPRRASQNTQSPPVARNVPSSNRPNGVKKDAKPKSPEAKPRPTRVPASAAAPTTASAAKSGTTTTLARKPTITKREHPPAKPPTSTVPAAKKASRTSLPPQTNGTDRTKPRTSVGRKAPDEGFLARMMRPTASSAQKAHEKVAPSSPPQSKRAAPVQAVKKVRRSLATSEEDKENSHRGGAEMMDHAPSTTEARQVEPNGGDNAQPSPLKDITPAEPEVATAESKAEALEASTD